MLVVAVVVVVLVGGAMRHDDPAEVDPEEASEFSST
jgi:hypothetical protein